MKPVLIYLRPLNKRTNQRVDVRVADGPSADVFGTAGYQWEPAVTVRPKLSIELMSVAMDGKVQAGQASFTIALDQVRNVPGVRRLYWSGAAVVIHNTSILEGPTAIPDFYGYVSSFKYDPTTRSLSVTAEASTVFIDRPLLTREFTGGGTGTPSAGTLGEAGLRGTLMPLGFGVVKNIQPVWFDTTRNIGMIDGYGNTRSIDWLGEGLSSFGPRVADYASYAALAAAIDTKAIKSGQWGTCVAQGLVGLGAPQTGIITVHATFGLNRIGAISKRILLTHAAVPPARVDTATFDAFDILVNRPVHYWTATQRSVKDLLEALAASANATPLVTFQNQVTITRAVSSAPALTLDRSGSVEPRVIDWQSADAQPPTYQLKARAARPASVLTDDQVNYTDTIVDLGLYNLATVYRAGNITWLSNGSQWLYQNAVPSAGHAPPNGAAADANGFVQDAWWFRLQPPKTASDFVYKDGTPVQALQPKQAGADVTLDNTSKNIVNQGALAVRDTADFTTQVSGATKPANNATNSADPNSPFGGTTVGAFANRVVNVENVLGPGGYVQTRFDQLQTEIDQGGGGSDDTLVRQRVTSLEASARGAGSANPNLLVNSQFSDTSGMNGAINGWIVGSGSWGIVGPTEVGNFAQSKNANAYLYQDVTVSGGGIYSLSAEMDPDQAQGCYTKVDFLNSSGGNLGANGVAPVYADNWVRGYTADNVMKAPNGAAKARVYCANANTNSYGRFTRIQFQRGGVPTVYRDDSDTFYNASRITSEIVARTNAAGTYATQFTNLTSQFAGSQGSFLLSQINRIDGNVTTNNETISRQVNTLTSNINALSSPNLLANGAFSNYNNNDRSQTPGWVQFNGASWYVVAEYVSSASGIFAQSTSSKYSGIYSDVGNIQPGKNYCVGFESSNDGGDNHCYMSIQWLNSGGAQISQVDGTGTSGRSQTGWGVRLNDGPWQAPSGAATARVILYLYGSGTGNKRVTRLQFQQSNQATAYSDSASLQGLQAQVTQQAGTIATLQGYLGAYFTIQANAGDATAFVSVRAMVNGQTTSDVSIGAKEFLVYNDVNGQLLKTFVASGGNVRIYGNLQLDGSVSRGNLQDNSSSELLVFTGGGQTWPGDGQGGVYTAPSGGGSTGCPSADTPLLMANEARDGAGDRRAAGRVAAGDWVWTQHEETFEWGAFEVLSVRHFWASLHGGDARPRTTADHPFWLDDKWTMACELGPPRGQGPAVQLQIDQARTFITFAPNGDQLLSHNKTTQP